jgi:hypothetical protein
MAFEKQALGGTQTYHRRAGDPARPPVEAARPGSALFSPPPRRVLRFERSSSLDRGGKKRRLAEESDRCMGIFGL